MYDVYLRPGCSLESHKQALPEVDLEPEVTARFYDFADHIEYLARLASTSLEAVRADLDLDLVKCLRATEVMPPGRS